MNIKDKLKELPKQPGCYLMKNKDNIVIYVGKSKNLKNRLSSYFQREHTGKTMMLVREIDHFEYIITNTEMESLLLEINLIKKYNPKYNILYRDDKSYPYIELTDEKVPSLKITRRINAKKIKNNLFGPYPNVGAAKRVVEILNRIYPLKKCRTYEKRECLYYHIGECLGYCTHNVDDDKIKEMILSEASEKKIEQINSDINVATERKENNKTNKERFLSEIEEIKTRITELEEERKQKQDKKLNLNTNKEKFEKELAEKETELLELTKKLSEENEKSKT